MPDKDIQYGQILHTYKSDEHAEVDLAVNLYELNVDWPYTGQYEFSLPIVVAANSRGNMEYTASYGTGDIYIYDVHTLTLGDNEGVRVDINYDTPGFWFYGAWYTEVFITSNGFVTFDDRAYNDNGGKWTSPNPASIPTTDGPNAIIAPFWRDLDPSKGGTIEYGTGLYNDFAVVWRDVYNKANGNTQTFALYFSTTFPETSYITFIYGSITNDVPTSIGIEDQTGKQGQPVASMSSGKLVEFTDSPPDNYYRITNVKVSMSKLTVGEVNDNKSRIYIQGWEDSRPGGTNVILEDPTEGKYEVPPIIKTAVFAVGTAGLLTGWGWLAVAGYLGSAAILGYELSPMPRGTTVHEAMESTQTAYVKSRARDENYGVFDHACDVSISPLILWTINEPGFHKLLINAEVTIEEPNGNTYTLTTDNIELNLLPPDPSSLTVFALNQEGSGLTSGDVYVDGEFVGLTDSIFDVGEGNHQVFVNDFWEPTLLIFPESTSGNRYTFQCWEDGSESPTRTVDVPEVVIANFTKKYCPGDVNGDGIVDIVDIVIAALAFGSTRLDPEWTSIADLNCDGIIDIVDQVIIAIYFGAVYW